MAKKPTPEEEKEKSGRGFDKPSTMSAPAQKALTALIVIGALIFALIASGTLNDILGTFDGGGGYSGGEVRNCIASSLGNPIDCAPSSGGECLPTIINGRAPDDCGTDGCELVTIPGAMYNPYRNCWSVTNNKVCIPCP